MEDDDLAVTAVTGQLPETDAGHVLSLYLAGATLHQISRHYDISVQNVKQVVDTELAHRQPGTPGDDALELERLTALWRGVYGKAIGGDQEAAALALRIGTYRAELAARTRTRQHPDDPTPAPPPDVTPTAAVRTAWSILAGNAPHVAQVLVDIARFSPNDAVRVPAAVAVLDRVGIGRVERSEVAVHLLDQSAAAAAGPDSGVTAASALVRQRLAAIRARHDSTLAITDGTVVDAVE